MSRTRLDLNNKSTIFIITTVFYSSMLFTVCYQHTITMAIVLHPASGLYQAVHARRFKTIPLFSKYNSFERYSLIPIGASYYIVPSYHLVF